MFKEYSMGQIILLPTNLDEAIPPNHLVRVVNQYVEKMDLTVLKGCYPGGGASSYHPKMMLKVVLYAYTQKIYSSRRIAKALRESLPFMWLSGMNRPDFRTINRFRGVVLQGVIATTFAALLKLLIEEGYVKLADYFVDGTKVEANANRYTAVWAKNQQRYEKKLAEQVEGLMVEIERLNEEEDRRYGVRDLEEMGEAGPIDAQQMERSLAGLKQRLQEQPAEEKPGTDGSGPGAPAEESAGASSAQPPALPEEEASPAEEPGTLPSAPAQEATPLSRCIEQAMAQVLHLLEDHPQDLTLRRTLRCLTQNYLPRARKYARQKRLLAGRNSYSTTDPDAVFMRMKDDHHPQAHPKAAYNVQIGTENQFVVNYSLHQEAGDSTCFIPHLQQLESWIGCLPEQANGDSAYGSEENYAYLQHAGVGNYLKYSGFDRQQKPRYHPNPFEAENMPYDAAEDRFTCPNGKALTFSHSERHTTKNGFQSEQRMYRCRDCAACPLNVDQRCTRSAVGRTLAVRFSLWEYRQQARQNLESAKGVRLRKRRGVDVEPVFGQIKEDRGFRRFLLRGLEKVKVEWGLICLAHNLAKIWSANNAPQLASS